MLLSQNFLSNRELISKLVRDSSISSTDTVIEIGPGTGSVTFPLLSQANHVTAIEIDSHLKLPPHPKLTWINQNFLDYTLPKSPYKVFSNIPFNITGEIIKKLLFASNPPIDAYLVVQNEAAVKFLISPRQNTMLSILFFPWFDIKIIYRFNRTDFYPTPKVDSCLLRIEKRKQPLLSNSSIFHYRNFIVWHFTYNVLAKFTSPQNWLHLFRKNPKSPHNIFSNWLLTQNKLQKIHRTR